MHHICICFSKNFSGRSPDPHPVAIGYSLTHSYRHNTLIGLQPPPAVHLVFRSVTDNAMYIFNAILLKINLSLSEFKRLYLHPRLHHFAYFFQNFHGPPEPPPTGGDTPPVPSPLGTSGLEKTPPPGWVLDPPLARQKVSKEYLHVRAELCATGQVVRYVGPNLTGSVCILDTIFIDRNTAGQTNKRKDAQNLTIKYFRLHPSYKMLQSIRCYFDNFCRWIGLKKTSLGRLCKKFGFCNVSSRSVQRYRLHYCKTKIGS